MVSGCVNPECRREFRLLDGGDLYAYERADATEFFWLCAECARRLEAYLDAEGEVRVRLRGSAAAALQQHHAGRLRIVAAAARRIPWRHSVPADEHAAVERQSYWMAERRERSGPSRKGWG